MHRKRKFYKVNLNPAVIELLDVYILKEKKRAFVKNGICAYALRCWQRWFFIEQAIKELKDFTCISNHYLVPVRRPYSIKLDPDVLVSFDSKILNEKSRALAEDASKKYGLGSWSRNRFIERAIKQLIEG